MPGFRLTSEARDELNAGVDFYDAEYAGLGRDFALEVLRLCRLIAESPSAGVEVRPGVRRRTLRRFPYSILYTPENGRVLVLAVAHQRRRPGYWHRRVQAPDAPPYGPIERAASTANESLVSTEQP